MKIDTNILVYAYDTSEGAKHDFAKNIVKQIWQDGGGVVCGQNLKDTFLHIIQGILYMSAYVCVCPRLIKKGRAFVLRILTTLPV